MQQWIVPFRIEMNAVGERLASKSKWSNLLKSSYVKTIILAAIVLGSVVVFWAGVRVALGTEYPLLTVASGSMTPTLNRGDLIVVQGVSNYSEVKAGLWKSTTEGDIIIFHKPPSFGQDDLIVHRAIEKFQGTDGLWYFKTAGDHNDPYPSIDPWGPVPQSLVVGKVVGHVPWLGYIPLYVRTPLGMVLLIILILIIVFAEYIPFSSRKQETAKD